VKLAIRLTVCILLLLLLGGAAAWKWSRPEPSPSFSLGSRRVKPQTAPSLTVGHNIAAMVAPDGTLWAWGDPGSSGSDLGISPGWIPQKISNETDWKQVTAGYYGVLALKKDGSLWAIGSNLEGLLGLTNSPAVIAQLKRVGTDKDWNEIQAGVAHCLALKNDGSLWAWGHNNYGQIGIGKITPCEPPTRIGQETNWLSISPGAFSSYALRNDGTIWAWGLDFVTSRKNSTPIQVGSQTNWTRIAAGEYHVAAISEDGSCWIIGANAGLIATETSNPVTNWFKLNQPMNWVDIRSGENCLLGMRNGIWYPAGKVNSFGAEGSWFPHEFEPLALHTQRETTLIFMPDGRLWSLGKRIGANPTRDVIEKLRGALFWAIGRSSNTPTDHNDSKPFMVWEQK
jgi:alpha-tubulin suppressor-like RCC1 family protein